MSERKYTVAEIDLMRSLIRTRYIWGAFRPRLEAEQRLHPVWYTESDMRKVVEEQLRTYMLAGLGPDDLVDTSRPEDTEDHPR